MEKYEFHKSIDRSEYPFKTKIKIEPLRYPKNKGKIDISININDIIYIIQSMRNTYYNNEHFMMMNHNQKIPLLEKINNLYELNPNINIIISSSNLDSDLVVENSEDDERLSGGLIPVYKLEINGKNIEIVADEFHETYIHSINYNGNEYFKEDNEINNKKDYMTKLINILTVIINITSDFIKKQSYYHTTDDINIKKTEIESKGLEFNEYEAFDDMKIVGTLTNQFVLFYVLLIYIINCQSSFNTDISIYKDFEIDIQDNLTYIFRKILLKYFNEVIKGFKLVEEQFNRAGIDTLIKDSYIISLIINSVYSLTYYEYNNKLSRPGDCSFNVDTFLYYYDKFGDIVNLNNFNKNRLKIAYKLIKYKVYILSLIEPNNIPGNKKRFKITTKFLPYHDINRRTAQISINIQDRMNESPNEFCFPLYNINHSSVCILKDRKPYILDLNIFIILDSNLVLLKDILEKGYEENTKDVIDMEKKKYKYIINPDYQSINFLLYSNEFNKYNLNNIINKDYNDTKKFNEYKRTISDEEKLLIIKGYDKSRIDEYLTEKNKHIYYSTVLAYTHVLEKMDKDISEINESEIKNYYLYYNTYTSYLISGFNTLIYNFLNPLKPLKGGYKNIFKYINLTNILIILIIILVIILIIKIINKNMNKNMNKLKI